ncbi:MAG: HypC/HybG/HupF family hydrogenase formation chaperone [Methylocystis sp.]
MCLAVPMQIVSVEGHKASCDARGIRRDVSLILLDDQEIAVGDHVLVNVGYALQKVTAAHAKETWDLFDEITLALGHGDG